jgi:hypothetical protein
MPELLETHPAPAEEAQSRRRRRRRLRRVVVALTAVLTAGSVAMSTEASAALALGTAYWKPFQCSVDAANGRAVTAKAPTMTSVTGGLENVWWRADLYRWNGYNFVPYNTSKPWATAAANGSGTVYSAVAGSSWLIPPGTPLAGMSWLQLPSGYYRVLDHYYWERTGGQASAWPGYSGGTYYCTIS